MVVAESIRRDALRSSTACPLPAVILGLYVLYCRVDTQNMKAILYSSSRDKGYLYTGTADSADSVCHGKTTGDR
jgi:hypothetical protein